MRTICAILVLLLAPAAAHTQTSKSSAVAAELTALLDARKLDSFAARQGEDQFVAALYFPGSQLLVVGGKYSAPYRLTYLILEKSYRDAYADLSSAAEQATTLFVMDLGANGIHLKRDNNNLDTANVRGRSFTFNGEWGGRAKITEDEYRKAFESTDDEYARMLQTLFEAAKR